MTTGASNDLQQVRSIARRMVAQWGYSKDKMGATSWEDTQGNSPVNPAGVSQAKEKEIDDEVRVLVLANPNPTPTPSPTPTPAPAPNQMLFVALHGRHDQAVEVATKAVRRDMAIMCHPDKIRRYDSTKVMATAMMQRLGELASK